MNWELGRKDEWIFLVMEQLPKLCCDILGGKVIFALLALLFLMQLKSNSRLFYVLYLL